MRHLGYTYRPEVYCDMCGPFRSPFMRYLYTDGVGAVYRCHGCDKEGE